VIVEADHLVELAGGGMITGQVAWQADAVPRVEVHGVGDARGSEGTGREVNENNPG
jgi:hypothetical protein